MEGINLICSTYSDDEDEDVKEPKTVVHEEEHTTASNDEFAPECVAARSRPVTPQLVQQQKLNIVDYGHDEVAMSPETEEGEVSAADVVMIETQVQVTNNGNGTSLLAAAQISSVDTQATTTIQEQLDGSGSQAMDFSMNEPESNEAEEPLTDSVDGVTDDDLVAKFLPPKPTAKCSDELQERINKFLQLKRRGKSYNAEVRNKKEYRNPDFLRHAVTYQDIDEIGSCFRTEVFDPHGYDKSDFYDEIEADMKREMERKEQERKRSPKVEFITGGAQFGVGPSPKINIPIPAVPTPTAGGLRPSTAPVDSTSRDGRNKKSKWDKVDGYQKMSGANMQLLTAVNAGSGYTAFAQQQRRETEEKIF